MSERKQGQLSPRGMCNQWLDFDKRREFRDTPTNAYDPCRLCGQSINGVDLNVNQQRYLLHSIKGEGDVAT